MVKASQRTLYMCDIDLHRQLSVEYKPLENTTLNEKFSVLQSEEVPNDYPVITGFVIGIGGTPMIEGNENYVLNEHSPIDGALFEHVPFIMRPIEADLNDSERENYRLRVIEIINNRQYVSYYMKVANSFVINNNFYTIKTVYDGTSVSSPSLTVFDNNVETILNPVPRPRRLDYKYSKGCEYISKLCKLNFILTSLEQEEIKNALAIKNKESRLLTELGVCTGVTKDCHYGKESMITQIAYHVPINFDLAVELAESRDMVKAIELGGLEPLIY